MNVSKFLKFIDMTQSPHDTEAIRKAVVDYLAFQKKFQDVEADTSIYRISCKDETVHDCYVGHTSKPIATRLYHHRKTCENGQYRYHNKKLYQFIRTHGGFDQFTVEILERGLMNKYLARFREQHFIDFFNPSLNKVDSYSNDHQSY